MASNENPCAVSQELINLQCLQCGAVTSGNFITIVECPRCGALDYHLFKGYVPLEEAARHRRAVAAGTWSGRVDCSRAVEASAAAPFACTVE